MEEFARFVLEDRHLSELAKSLRHELNDVVRAMDVRERLTARAVASDCGTTITVEGERTRSDVLAVAQSAAARTQEALRCIEEYGKTLEPFDSPKIESIRYRVYTLAATLVLTPSRVERLRDAKLYLLIDCGSDAQTFSSSVEALFGAGVDVIQLRDKQADDRRLYQCAKIAAQHARRLGKLFIMNDRADIAAATNASGVHVGQEELPVEAVRRIIGGQALIGVSTHDLDQAKAAVLDGADYIGCGPTFPSRTKTFDGFPGTAFLREVASEITLPTYAIGGIDEDNLDEVLATGIHGVALSSAIMSADDPEQATIRLKAKLSHPLNP